MRNPEKSALRKQFRRARAQMSADERNAATETINRLLNDSITSYKIDTALFKFNNTLDQFNKTARAIQDSWLIRLFPKKKTNEKSKKDTTKME